MPTELEIAWLAGLLDGEVCIAFARRTDYRPEHRFEVRYDVNLAMACKDTVETAYEMIVEIVGDDLAKFFEEKRRIKRLRPLWRCEVSSKLGVSTLLNTVLPYLRTKHLEASLCVRYLERALPHKRYHADDYDRHLAELATALRHGCGEARAEATSLLSQVIPSEALLDFGPPWSKGGRERVETRQVSSNNNPAHECPAPDSLEAKGEEIVRSPGETQGDVINRRRPLAH